MSYMRIGHPLEWFKKGETKSYVFKSSGIKGGKDFIEDYNCTYNDNKSFCELIHNIIERTTTPEYAQKILRVLAKKLRVEKDLLKKRKSSKQYWKEADKNKTTILRRTKK